MTMLWGNTLRTLALTGLLAVNVGQADAQQRGTVTPPDINSGVEQLPVADIDSTELTPKELRNQSFRLDIHEYFQINPSQQRWPDVFDREKNTVGIYAVENVESSPGARVVTLDREQPWGPSDFEGTSLDDIIHERYYGSAEDKMDRIFRKARYHDKKIAWNTGKQWFLDQVGENALWAHHAMDLYDASDLPTLLTSHLLIESGLSPLRRSSSALGIAQISEFGYERAQRHTPFVADWGDPGFELPLAAALLDAYRQLYGDELSATSAFHSGHYNFRKFKAIGERVVPDSVADPTVELATGIRTGRELLDNDAGYMLRSAGQRSMDYPGQVASLTRTMEELTDTTKSREIYSYVTDRRWTADELLEATEMNKDELLRYNPHLRTDLARGYRVMSPGIALEHAWIPENGRVNSPNKQYTLGVRDTLAYKMERSNALKRFHETEFDPHDPSIVRRLDSVATELENAGLWNHGTAIRSWIIPELKFYHRENKFGDLDQIARRVPRYLDTKAYKSNASTTR